MKRILLVDDHRLFLDGMQHMLKQLGDDVCIDSTDTVAGALRKFDEKIRYDLLLLDISLPEMSGFSMIQSLNERGIILPIAVISSSSDVNDIRRCLELGASGFIHKNSSGEEMLSAVKRILDGQVVLPHNISSQLDLALRSDNNDPILVPTSNPSIGERQIEVLKLIDQGMSNKQIASVLAISEATVKYHIGILFKQLGVRNRTSCLIKARQKNMIEER
jgi:DNA-binding NarL/FixJ family response regulator